MIAVDKQPSIAPGRDGVERSHELLATSVRKAVREQAVWDFHTHLYPPAFGTPFSGAAKDADPAGLLLWGIDELLTYHYLVAEVYRVVTPQQLPYEAFWRMTKR